MSLHPSLRVKFNSDFEQIGNSEFVSGTALIAYIDENRNKSDIPETAFEDAMPSLGLIPIVGHWLPEKQNFGGHDVTIEWAGNELVLKDNTVPYGVVKENHNAEWVEINDNGKIHKYLKADVILWHGRYPEPVQKVIDTGVNQSMEINPLSFQDNKDGYFTITKFEYSALCLLGKDIDENGVKGESNVEPCFESASVVIDKFGLNENFKEQFNNLLFAFKNGENQELTTEESPEKVFTETEKEEVILDEKLSFSATYKQKKNALENALDPIILKTEDGNYISETYYYVADFSDEYVMVEKDYWDEKGYECTYGRFTYTFDEATITATITGEFEKMINVWLTEAENQKLQEERMEMESVVKQYNELVVEFGEYKTNFETLKSEKENLSQKVVSLQQYKDAVEYDIKKALTDEMVSEFEATLGDNDEFKIIKENALNYELDALEKELFALEGKVKHSKSAKFTKKPIIGSKVSIPDPKKSETESYYGEAVKYITK